MTHANTPKHITTTEEVITPEKAREYLDLNTNTMSAPITFSIDVTLLDKSRFKHITRQSGVPAIFCDMIILPNKQGPDRFGNDAIVKQQTSKEERLDGKVEMPILGNAKKIEARIAAPAPASAPAAQALESSENIPW